MCQAQSYTLAPIYKDTFCRSIGVLQNLQTLLSNDATLADVAQMVRAFQQEFGFHEHLEDVIQSLVGCSLKKQMTSRKAHDFA